MSLADQSQQWFPTSVQVTVHQARNLRVKGKNGTNDAYAIIQVAKDKFSTSVAEKSVAPVWKEEASFDLPLFHLGNAERCTLYIIVMHRAHAGLDKFLGQAVVNLLDLHDNKSRIKTDWFKMVDKSGKQDKERGEVLLDIHFMRNNISASMFDLSMGDKPRSRISKLKDKVRGKKKDGFSDSASAIVPSVTQVLTDSEGEGDSVSLNQTPAEKKKSKLKSLFAPKSNLHRNASQSLSTLGPLSEKNSSLSGSRSSGLNVDSPEVKKKFKFLGHKRTGSTDSKVSQGPFSLLGRSKQSNSDLNSLCINGNHVYAEEDAEPKSGSTLSLNSAGQVSVEDFQKESADVTADPFKNTPVPSYERASKDQQILLEQQRYPEEQERMPAEGRPVEEARRLVDEERYRAGAKKLQEEEERRLREEQERRRRILEEEERGKKRREEEEEQRKKLKAAENERLEEERLRQELKRQEEQVQKAEEQRRQEEASMSERLSSLFGMIKKKEEKKEEVQQPIKEELPSAPRSDWRDPDQPATHVSTNPFEDLSLSKDTPVTSTEIPADQQKLSRNQQTPSAVSFLNRATKVSAVKPRLAHSLTSENTECQTPSKQAASPAASESSLSTVPSESPDTFSNLHASLAPPNIGQNPFDSPSGSIEKLPSITSPPTMAEKRRAPLPPLYTVHEASTGGNIPVRDNKSPTYSETNGLQQDKKPALPLPDYDILFPQRRHGVQGHTKWDNIIAEVNQKHRDTVPELLGPEMSVDGPDEHEPKFQTTQEDLTPRHLKTQPVVSKPISLKKVAAPAPPKPMTPQDTRSFADSRDRQNQNITQSDQHVARSDFSAGPGRQHTDKSDREILPEISRDGARRALQPPSSAAQMPRPTSLGNRDTPSDNQGKTSFNPDKEAPVARPRQKISSKAPVQQQQSATTPALPQNKRNSTLSSSSMKEMDKNNVQSKENIADFEPLRQNVTFTQDPWNQNQGKDDFFAGNVQPEQNPVDWGMTTVELDQIFGQEKSTDAFGSNSGNSSAQQMEWGQDNSEDITFAFQRKNSQRKKPAITSATVSAKVPEQEPAYNEDTAISAASQVHPRRDIMNETISSKHQADEKTQINLYGGLDSLGADPFTAPSILTNSQPLHVVMEEPAAEEGMLSLGKTPLRARVSPSDVQAVSAQSSNGGGLALTLRRPHPVKPMNSIESQYPISASAGKESKIQNSTSGKIKVADSLGGGPYTQLTQEELITLVVKQQADLSKRDAKITELEEYIDNLLVRVIEEKPAILQTLNAKPV